MIEIINQLGNLFPVCSFDKFTESDCIKQCASISLNWNALQHKFSASQFKKLQFKCYSNMIGFLDTNKSPFEFIWKSELKISFRITYLLDRVSKKKIVVL